MDSIAAFLSRYQLTPAAERALAEAAHWADPHVGHEQLLLGLLAETECKAAEILRRFGLDSAAVERRFPQLRRDSNGSSEPPTTCAPSLVEVFLAAETHSQDLSGAPTLATEQLLLGLVGTDSSVGTWLRDVGLKLEELSAEVSQIHGVDSSGDPLPMPEEEEPGGVEDFPSDELAPPVPREQVTQNAAVLWPSEKVPTFVTRVLDAAANRAREGLRVAEDYCRFVRDDRELHTRCKSARHELAAALALLPHEDLLAARDTQSDVGTGVTSRSESDRGDAHDVASAAFKRAQEALRTLEEFGKLANTEFAAAAKSLRYQVYALEQKVLVGNGPRRLLSATKLYVLLDGRQSLAAFESITQKMIAGGVQAIQLRDKRLSDRELLDRAKTLRSLTRGHGVLFVMNDRPDLAVLSEADGIHVGQDELPVCDVRRIVDPKMIVGVSAHSLKQARAAVHDGADYIGIGPLYPSGTKSFSTFVEADLVRQIAKEIPIPVFAIGGIDAARLPDLRATGLNRVAVSGAILNAPDAESAARNLRALLDG